jgi:hypothetical protein
MFSGDQACEVKSSDARKSVAATLPLEQANGDRSRLDRIERPSPTLISILRHPTVVIDTDSDLHDLRASKGIVRGILLSLPIWVLFIVGISWTLR